jgi:hypothetical protein
MVNSHHFMLWLNQDEQDKVIRGWLEQQNANHETKLERHGQQSQQQIIFRIKGIMSVVHPLASSDKNDIQVSSDYSADHVNPKNGIEWTSDDSMCKVYMMYGKDTRPVKGWNGK